MKENLLMVFMKAKENINGPMELYMKVILKIIKSKEKEFGFGPMVIYIKANLKMGNIMDMEN